MMKLNVDENPGLAARYGIPGLVVLLATLFWFAPAALAFTPTPSGGFVGDTGSNDEVAQRNRVDDARSGLQLGLRAQEASDRGDYKEAEVLYERALLLFEGALGPEDLRLVGPLANLADVYRALGKFDRAEVLYARVAFLMEEAFGPSDVLVGAALADTAEAVASQGHYGRAKNLYQRAFLIYQVSLGTEDPGTVRLFKDFDLQWTHHENSHRDVRRFYGPRNGPAAFAEGPQPQAVAIDRTADATVRVLVEGGKLLLGMNDIILEVRPSVESSEVSHAKLVAARPGLPTESVSVDLLPEGAGRFRGTLTLPWTDSCRLEVAWDDAQGHHARGFVVPVIVGHH